MFDYAKYENATQKEIIHALNLTQRKSEKLTQQLKENREIFKFLQKKLKESFSSKKNKKNNIPNGKTINALNNNTSIGVFNDFNEAKKALMSDEKN